MPLLDQVRALSPTALSSRSALPLSDVLAFGCTGTPLAADTMHRLQQLVDANVSSDNPIAPAGERAYATPDEVRDILTRIGPDGAKEIMGMRGNTYATYFHDELLSYSKLLRVKTAYLNHLQANELNARYAPLPTAANKHLVKTRVALVKIAELVNRLTDELDAHIKASANPDDADANA